MGIRSFIKNTVKTNTNVKSWSAWNTIKENANVVKGFANDIKVPDAINPGVKVTFEDAMKKYGVSESDLASRMKSHFTVAIFCGLLGLAALIWTIYLLTKLMFLSSLVGIALSLLMFSYGFREHFYYYQIKQRRLNCTVKEWLSGFLSNKRSDV